MKPGSLDSSGDVEYYGFYSFALPFLVFRDIQLLRAFFGSHFVPDLTWAFWGKSEATFHVNQCSKLAISELIFDPQ